MTAAKAAWRQARRTYRPWVPTPGEHLVVDWASEGGWEFFCAVLAWSRYRFVRIATDQTRATTLQLMAECFAELGGVPAVVLTDRMACLRASIVANVVVPHPEYVQVALQAGFRPDFCESADPESKAMVEHLAGYVQRDLLVPSLPSGGWADLTRANAGAERWCAEVNGRVHSTISAVPAARLVIERGILRPLPSVRPLLRAGEPRKVDLTGMIRFGSARYAVASDLVGQQVQVRADDGMVIITREGEELHRYPALPPGAVALARTPTRRAVPPAGSARAPRRSWCS